MEDMIEFWSMVDNAPKRIPFKEGDRDGYQLDLMVRASHKAMSIPEVRESLTFLLVESPFAMIVRPAIMMLSRAYNSIILERLQKNK